MIRKTEDEIAQFETLKCTHQPGPGCGGFAGNQKRNDNYCFLSLVPVARPSKCYKCGKRKLFCVCSTTCIVSCCQSCTFCLKCERAVTKERRKSLIKCETRNKICQRGFFCRSLRFCPSCSKCPQCCQCSSDRGTSPKILAEVVPPGCKSESSVHYEGRLHSAIQDQTSSGKGSFDSQWLCKPPQEPLPERGFAGLTAKGGSRDGEGSNISSLLQPTVHSSKTKPKMAANLGPQCSKQIFECKNIQNGNPRNNSDFLTTGGMGDIAGFQRRLFPHSSSCKVPEISQVPFPKSVLSVPGSSLWPLHSSDGVHLCGQRV